MVDNIIMYTGLGITIIGLLLLVFTTKWVNGWFINYKTTNLIDRLPLLAGFYCC